MKNLKCIVLFLIFISCKDSRIPSALFDQPQPIGKKNISGFPHRLAGIYFNSDKSSELMISKNLISHITSFDCKVHPNEFDTNTILSGDTIINTKTKEKVLFKKDGDSLVCHTQYTDTLFIIDKNHILKKFKGYYFLNTAKDPQAWEVKKLAFSSGKLTISGVYSDGAIQSLQAITETPNDTISPHKFNPTRKQFKKFVKAKGFTDDETYFKVK